MSQEVHVAVLRGARGESPPAYSPLYPIDGRGLVLRPHDVAIQNRDGAGPFSRRRGDHFRSSNAPLPIQVMPAIKFASDHASGRPSGGYSTANHAPAPTGLRSRLSGSLLAAILPRYPNRTLVPDSI